MTRLLEDKEFDCTTFGWGQTWDNDPSQIWHSESARSAKGSNYGSYMSPEVDAIIEELKREFDLAKRKEIWARFQRTINEDQPYLFDVITTRAYVIQGRVKHFYFNKIRPQVWFLPWAIG